MKSLLLLLLLPFLVLADSESAEEEVDTTEFICGVILDDDKEAECKTCANKALSEGDITETEEQAKYESEAMTILHSCTDHLPAVAERCINELNSIDCLDLHIQTKESTFLATAMCMEAQSKAECMQCVYSTAIDKLKSSTLPGIKSIRRDEIAESVATSVVFGCLGHFMPKDLDNFLSSESSE